MKFRLIENTDNENNELTPEQEKFFRNSKVRNSSGDLLVCYRGTANINNRTGFSGDIKWFSTNQDYSDRFSLDNGIVYSVYLNCRRIFDCGNTDGRLFKITPLINPQLTDYFLNILKRLDISEELFRNTFKQELSNKESYTWRIFQITRNTKFKNLVERSGYDCIKTIEEGDNVCYGVFNNKDIKLTSNKYPTDSVNINESMDTLNVYYGNDLRSDRIKDIVKDCMDRISLSEYRQYIDNITFKEEDNLQYNGNIAGALTTSYSIDGSEVHHIITINHKLSKKSVDDYLIKSIVLHEIAHVINRNKIFEDKSGKIEIGDGYAKFADGHDGEWRRIANYFENTFEVKIPETGGIEYAKHLK